MRGCIRTLSLTHHQPTTNRLQNVPLDWDDEKLSAVFGEHGELTSAKIMYVTDKDVEAKPDKGLKVGDSKGFAFVSYKEHEGAKAAVEKLHEMKLPPVEGAEEGAEEKTLFVGRSVLVSWSWSWWLWLCYVSREKAVGGGVGRGRY